MTDTPSEEARVDQAPADLTPAARLRSTLDELQTLAKAGAGRQKLGEAVDRAQAAAADLDAEHADTTGKAGEELAAVRDENDDLRGKLAAAEQEVTAARADTSRQQLDELQVEVGRLRRELHQATEDRDTAHGRAQAAEDRVTALQAEAENRPAPGQTGGLTGVTVDEAPSPFGLVEYGGTVYSMPEATEHDYVAPAPAES